MGTSSLGALEDKQLGALEADIRHMRDLQARQDAWTKSELRRIELRVNAKSKEIRELEKSINKAVLYLAIAAGAVVFELIRKGNPF